MPKDITETELTPPPPPNISGHIRSSDGDWTCSNCENINFARRNVCNRCKKEKAPMASKRKKLGQEIGKAAAEKSRGLFSADDWQCNKCGNVNWARRQQCNVCNAPKFGEIEERTGLGGGYNDRGVVEYKERSESDDEYDEFGRRRKKKNRNRVNESTKEQDNIKEKNKKDDTSEKPFEEDEDEDEGDEDLSKYDLSKWDNDVHEDEGDEDLSKYDLSEWDNDVHVKPVEKRRSLSRSKSRSPIRKDK